MEALVTIIIAIVVLFAAVMTAVFWLAPRPLLDSRPPGTQVPASLGPVELETWLTEHEARYAGVIDGTDARIDWATSRAITNWKRKYK